MIDLSLVQQQQKILCSKLKIDWTPIEIDSLIAFNDSLLSRAKPINGLRHPRDGYIEGWYLWAGGDIPKSDDNFFKPLHASHLIEMRPVILKYLGLPPGWRFQIDEDGYEDIWFDKTILTI